MNSTMSGTDRYTVISADGHAGADLLDYRAYLPSRGDHDFDAWAPTYVNPFADLLAPTAFRNWDSDRRLAELESDGVAAEVLFPNTVPPFFEQSNLLALPPTVDEYERRWAGVQAHNRWLVDFCAAAPGRRAGVIQVFLNDVDDAVAEIRSQRKRMTVCGGVLLPAVPPNSGLHELWDPTTSLCGRSVKNSTSRSTSTAAAGSRTSVTSNRHAPSCWWNCPGSRTGRYGTSSLVGCSTGTPACAWPSPSRGWPGCPGGSTPSNGSLPG